jgi:hypothetical protein
VTAAGPPGSSTPHAPSHIPSQDRSSPITIALIVWLLIQLSAIALAASGMRLSANFPEPPRSMAVHEMLIAQFVSPAMFLSLLFRGGWRAWLGMTLTAGPMLMLGGWLAQMPMSRIVLAWGELSLWLTALALWAAVVRVEAALAVKPAGFSPRPLPLAAIAIVLSAGGLLYSYLRAEFRPASAPDLTPLFPLLGTLRNLNDPFNPSPLLSTAALSAAALVILAAKASRLRSKMHARVG